MSPTRQRIASLKRQLKDCADLPAHAARLRGLIAAEEAQLARQREPGESATVAELAAEQEDE